jgi:hypothetical protein
MRHARRWVPLLAFLWLTACGTAQPPSLSLELGSALTSDVLPGAAFLPPVGPSVDTRGFFAGASLEVEVHALDRNGVPTGDVLGPVLSAANGAVRTEDEFYLALWRVSDTAARWRDVSLVRVVVWASELAGSHVGDTCAAAERCRIGSFDALIRKSKNVKSTGGVLDLTRTQTLPIKVFIGGFRPERLGDLVRLSDGLPFDDTDVRSCVVNEFTMPGQSLRALGASLRALGAGLRALGAEGGLFLLGPDDATAAPGIRLFDPAEAGALARGLVRDAFLYDAAILVVDDFGYDPATFGPIYEISTELTQPADGLLPDALKALVTGGGFSHGALVLRQIVQMVEAAGFEEVAGAGPQFRIFQRYVTTEIDAEEGETEENDRSFLPDYLVVAAVDTSGFNTDVIAARIQNALNALRYLSGIGTEYDLDVGRVAINMSFAIVPCSVLEDFEASLPDTFEAYVQALGDENQVAEAFYDDLVDVLTTPLAGEDEPLLEQIVTPGQCDNVYLGSVGRTGFGTSEVRYTPPLDQFPWELLVNYPYEAYYLDIPCWDGTDGMVNYVASAGNFFLDYPMYPAAWPLVVGVSSQDAAETAGFLPTKSSFSNSGEVMAPGALLELGRSAPTSADPRALGYAGTSFAAPVVTLYTALDLMQRAPQCGTPLQSALTGAADTGSTELALAIAGCATP